MTTPMSFEDFERDYLKRHKGSRISAPVVSSWALMGGIALWALIALGAALVSGAHSVPAILQTIPAVVPSPFREILSLFGFTIFELLIFAGAMYRHQSRFAGWGLFVAMFGALAANIGSSIFTVTHSVPGDSLNLAVALVLSLIAPLAAFLAGEMVHRLFEQHHEKITAAQGVYTQRRKALDREIDKAFTKYLSGFTNAQPLHEISRNDFMKSDETDISPTASRNAVKPRVKIHEVARQVHENGDADLPTAEMMAKYNISLGSTSKIRDLLRGKGGEFLQ